LDYWIVNSVKVPRLFQAMGDADVVEFSCEDRGTEFDAVNTAFDDCRGFFDKTGFADTLLANNNGMLAKKDVCNEFLKFGDSTEVGFVGKGRNWLIAHGSWLADNQELLLCAIRE
jgi:hypothetical protein